MKLSEAIRLGAMATDQCLCMFSPEGKTCALGAAAMAVGIPLDADLMSHTFAMQAMRVRWPDVMNHRVPCPACAGDASRFAGLYSVDYTISHLNDQHRWTREAIAEWVESIERSLEPQLPSVGEFLAGRTVPVSRHGVPQRSTSADPHLSGV